MSQKSEKQGNDGFKTRWGFIFAAMGSAIGLGNIWKYPYVAYESGGGSFLIPYLVAILVAGLPILILEFNIGSKFKSGSAPAAFKALSPKLEFIGWFQTMIAFIVPIYYSAVIAWVVYYLGASFTQAWGSDTATYFYSEVLTLGDAPTGPFSFGGFNLPLAGLITVVWIGCAITIYAGVQKGIERVNKFLIPSLLIMFAVVVIYSVTLDGATTGLQRFFAPQWDTISDGKIWVAAFAQVFFSTSICSGIMITYASYSPKKFDNNSNAIITGLGNSSVELAAGIGVFAALGFLATQSGVGVDDVAAGGPGLVFQIYPSILNELPAGIGTVVGVVFYLSLLFAGFSSLISLIEVVVAAVKIKFGVSRRKAAIVMCVIGYILSLLIVTNAGLYLLDVIDYFSNKIMWVISGIFEIVAVVAICVTAGATASLLGYGNQYTAIKISPKLLLGLLIIAGALLGYTFVQELIIAIKVPYEGYNNWFLIFWGWSIIAISFIAAIVLSIIKPKKEMS